MKIALAFVAALLLGGCATAQHVEDKVVVDLVAARDNFAASGFAVEATCMQQIIDRIGEEEAANLRVDGVISLGSVAYIKYSQLRGTKQQALSDECYAIVGKVLVAVGKRGVKTFSGGIAQ